MCNGIYEWLHISPYLLIKQLKIKPNLVEAVIKPPVPFFNSNDSNWLNKRADLTEYLRDMVLYSIISNQFHRGDIQ